MKTLRNNIVTVKEFAETMNTYEFVYSWLVVQFEELAKARDHISKSIMKTHSNYREDKQVMNELLENAIKRTEYLNFALVIAEMEKTKTMQSSNFGCIEQLLKWQREEIQYQARF
jgi:hypothetical protein